MCGICGLATFRPDRAIDEGTLRSMCAALRHRGPDDEGYLVEDGIGLAMRRLSIIDLVTGHQPIHNEDRGLWTVFNGEIYNYAALRDELRRLGHTFYTLSDTEVVVHAYEEYGTAFVDRLNGMFALALWDRRRRRLLLARDRVGIKPLYYSHQGGILAFASELKGIAACPTQQRRLDLVALQQYLALEHIPPPRTILEGVKKLPPGHFLTFDAAGVRLQPYWDVDISPGEASSPLPPSACKAELIERLREAVRLELVSDVPLGIFLSGGLDSSAVAAMATEIAPGKIKTFSLGFEDPSFDESGYAEKVASYLGTEHRSMRLEPQALWELVPGLPDILDEPLADASIIPTYALCRFAREHVKVALGGDGGDELLGGYSTLQAHKLAAYYRRVPSLVRRALVEPAVERLPVNMDNLSFDFRARRFVRDAGRPPAIRHHLWLGCFRSEEFPNLLSPEVARELEGVDPLAPVHHHLANCNCRNELNRVLYLDMKLYMESDILVKVDRASMANSLEVRVPLLNRVFADYVQTLPIDLKLHRFTRKYVFREALRDRLPRDILARGKHGFGLPISKWLRAELKELTLDLLSQARLKSAGILRHDYVESLLADHLAGRRDNRKQLWTLLVFQLWHDRYLGGVCRADREAAWTLASLGSRGEPVPMDASPSTSLETPDHVVTGSAPTNGTAARGLLAGKDGSLTGPDGAADPSRHHRDLPRNGNGGQ